MGACDGVLEGWERTEGAHNQRCVEPGFVFYHLEEMVECAGPEESCGCNADDAVWFVWVDSIVVVGSSHDFEVIFKYGDSRCVLD